jgi:ATP-dependent Clp protease ATP-binding subunit ClpA
VIDRDERLTEHALLTLMLAQEEARRLQHAYVGPEHLLLGLVREGNGVGARMLTNLGVELANVRSAVESIVGRGRQAVPAEIGMTPRAMRVLAFAWEEARRLRYEAAGTEHLLLGLTGDGEGIVAAVLESLGVNPERLRAQMTRLLVERSPGGQAGKGQAEHAANRDALRRSLEAIRRAKDAAISMQEYERVAHLGDQEAALVAELAQLEAAGAPAIDRHADAQSQAVTGESSADAQRGLGRTFRDAFDLGLALSPRARTLLEGARAHAELLGQSLIEPEHLLLALTEPEEPLAGELERRGIDRTRLRRAAESILGENLSRGDTWPFGGSDGEG